MSQSGRRPHRDREGPASSAGGSDPRPSGPLESLFQEAVKRATGLGISGLASTEEAVRRAVGDRLPTDWVQFFSDRGEGLRQELMDRLTSEFGQFLRSDEFEDKLRRLISDFDFDVSVRVSARPKRASSDRNRDARSPDE